jgi:hypothetical protein
VISTISILELVLTLMVVGMASSFQLQFPLPRHLVSFRRKMP